MIFLSIVIIVVVDEERDEEEENLMLLGEVMEVDVRLGVIVDV